MTKSPANQRAAADASRIGPLLRHRLAQWLWEIGRRIARDDGSMQWAYKGKPLYTYSKDAKPGDMTGDERGQVWHMAMP